MTNLMIASIFFLGTHLGISSTVMRAELVQSLGEKLYRVVYSIVALVGLIWMVLAYNGATYIFLWPRAGVLDGLTFLLMLVACLLFVCAVTSSNPTAMGQQLDADSHTPAIGIIRVTRHPMLWAFALWAIAHILSNGDLASLIFFGAIAALSLGGMISIDQRKSRENPPGWGIFMQCTSIVPFWAIIEKRQSLSWSEIGWKRIAYSLAFFVILLLIHPWLFGTAAAV